MTRTPEQWADWILSTPNLLLPQEQLSLLRQRIINALDQAVTAEREACAVVADDMMRLCGSHAAEQVAAQIRARAQDV